MDAKLNQLMVKQRVEQNRVTQNNRLTESISRERGRLRNFIRQRVPDIEEAEDILQDVFIEYIEAYRLPVAIEQVGAWLFRVARNRIIDRFRKKKESQLPDIDDELDQNQLGQNHWLDEVLPTSDAGPEAAYARKVLLTEIYTALDELPSEQRDVFVSHEIEGISFKQLAQTSGVSVNTLLARKRYAIAFLRGRLQSIYDQLEL